MIYLVYYAASVYFAYLALKEEDKRKFYLYSVISIALPVVLAGLRAYNVGIDVANYYRMTRYWNGASSSDSLLAYLTHYNTTGYGEYIFALFIGIIGQLTGNYHLFLLLCHLIIVTGIYIGAFRHKDTVNPLLVLVLFYLLFFSHSLNIIRQYMAMAIIFAVLKDLEKKCYRRYIITVLVASMIHTTALIALGAALIYWLLYEEHHIPMPGKKIVPSMISREIFIVVCLELMVISFLPIARFLDRLHLIPAKYDFYLYPEGLTLSYIVMGLLVMELTAVYLFRELMREKTVLFDFFVICSVSYLILQQFTGIINYGKRIASYYSLNNILTIALLANSFKNKKARMLVTAVILMIALFYWWYMYVLRNASETYPYVFFGASI